MGKMSSEISATNVLPSRTRFQSGSSRFRINDLVISHCDSAYNVRLTPTMWFSRSVLRNIPSKTWGSQEIDRYVINLLTDGYIEMYQLEFLTEKEVNSIIKGNMERDC